MTPVATPPSRAAAATPAATTLTTTPSSPAVAATATATSASTTPTATPSSAVASVAAVLHKRIIPPAHRLYGANVTAFCIILPLLFLLFVLPRNCTLQLEGIEQNHSIRFSTLIKTIIAIHQETVTARKIELM
jgi:hypothetical protein